jgi:alpha-tubulin suppressor-like RCC1 family protein
MHDIPEGVMTIIADRLSLQDVMHARKVSRFFARNFTKSYISKLISFILQKATVHIAQGDGFELILLKDGTVYSRGRNLWGVLGHGELEEVEHFTQIKGLPQIKQIVAHSNYAYYLAVDGEVYITGQDRLHLITGRNRLDLLDKSMKIYCPIPYKVPVLNKITFMSISAKTSFFVSESGKVFGCGTNDCGQVLPDCRGVMQELVEIPHISNAKTVTASIFHTIIHCGDYSNSFGANDSGQLCLGHCLGISGVHTFKLDFEPEKILVTKEATYFLKNNGQLYICGKAAKNDNDVPKRYKKIECVGSAKDSLKFMRLLKTTEVNVPHMPLISEIENLTSTFLRDNTQKSFSLPPSLIERLNQFSQLLKSTRVATVKLSERKYECESSAHLEL